MVKGPNTSVLFKPLVVRIFSATPERGPVIALAARCIPDVSPLIASAYHGVPA